MTAQMMKDTHYYILRIVLLCLAIFNLHISSYAQELNARVSINHSQIENTRTDVFDALQTKLTEFLNNQKWTEIPFRENEKIQCNFNITVNTYNQEENSFECSLLMNCSRPVYGSSYNTVSYAVNDADFTFVFTEFDQLEYQDNQIDNNLIALLAYYAYMIIGMDLDTMAPMGGTDCFHMAEDVATAGENLGFLPGDLEEKINPYLRPLNDALHEMLDSAELESFRARGMIELAPLAFMRGRTLNNSFIILDEAQNATNDQMLMFLTRLGFHSSCVISGDPTQTDLPHRVQSGLLKACSLLENIDGIKVCRFGKGDVLRHSLVERIVRAYEEDKTNRAEEEKSE